MTADTPIQAIRELYRRLLLSRTHQESLLKTLFLASSFIVFTGDQSIKRARFALYSFEKAKGNKPFHKEAWSDSSKLVSMRLASDHMKAAQSITGAIKIRLSLGARRDQVHQEGELYCQTSPKRTPSLSIPATPVTRTRTVLVPSWFPLSPFCLALISASSIA